MFSKRNIYSTAKHYFYSVLLYGLGIYIYFTTDYYSNYLTKTTKDLLLYLYITYLVVAPLIIFLNLKKDLETHKPAIVFMAIKRVIFDNTYFLLKHKKIKRPLLYHEEKTALLFMLVKLFYVPIMLNFLVGNYNALPNIKEVLRWVTLQDITYKGYAMALSFIFFVDVTYFSFGYLFEAGFLKNKVRSVEPTILGWAAALVCYPPFNTIATQHIGWSANDYIEFSSLNVTAVARIAIILLLLIYLWATLSLGTKCSNLTNRGIVKTGAYKYIRHPAYSSKTLSWWITTLPVMNISVFSTMFAWSFIYYIRAITEEKHLSMDPKYKAYCKETKYRFIPYII